MSKISVFLSVSVFLISLPLFSKEKSLVGTEISVSDTSDHLSLRSYSANYRRHRRNLSWAFEGEKEKAWDIGFGMKHSNGSAGTSKFEENRINGLIARKFSNAFLVEAMLGHVNQKNTSAKTDFSFLTYSIQAELQLEKTYLKFGFLHDNAVSDMNFPAASEQTLRKKVLNFELLYLLGKWRMRLSERFAYLSDKNEQSYTDLDIKYSLLTSEKWLLIGFGSSYYWTKFDLPGYWTPRKFRSYGLRIEASIPFSEKISLNAAGNLNRIITETGASGNGYYSNIEVQFGKRENGNIRVGYERIQSQQNSTIWYMDRPYIAANYSW